MLQCLCTKRLLWSWLYGNWIYNYLCNQCLSPLTLWVLILLRRGVLNTTLCDKVCQWLATGRWFSPVSSTNKTDRHDITEILLKVVLNTITRFLTRRWWYLLCGKTTCFVEFFNSASSLKWHVAPFWHIILIPCQPSFFSYSIMLFA
jgi:hypothetical protein